MQEFSSISVSSYEAGSLAERLTEQSRDGWDVVSIVPAGNTVTAYLCREAGSAAAAPTEDPVATEPAAEDHFDAEPADEQPPEPAATEPIDQPLLAGFAADNSEADTSPSTDTPDEATVATSDTTATADADTDPTAASGAAPAGWYADPSGRFEVRYWDGGHWTEHVARAGQQYTDPPVA